MQSSSDSFYFLRWQFPDPLHQLGLINRDNLGYVHDTRFRQIGVPLPQGNVSRSVPPVQVRRDQADYGCADAASVKEIALNYYAGVTFGRARPAGCAEIKPVNFTLANEFDRLSLAHQFSRITGRNFPLIRAVRRLSTAPASPA